MLIRPSPFRWRRQSFPRESPFRRHWQIWLTGCVSMAALSARLCCIRRSKAMSDATTCSSLPQSHWVIGDISSQSTGMLCNLKSPYNKLDGTHVKVENEDGPEAIAASDLKFYYTPDTNTHFDE